MYQTFTAISLAPVVTGHPLGLPEPRRALPPQIEIKPVAKRGDTSTGLLQPRMPGTLWPVGQGKTDGGHAAPPTMLQMLISHLLEEMREADNDASESVASTDDGDDAEPDHQFSTDEPPTDATGKRTTPAEDDARLLDKAG